MKVLLIALPLCVLGVSCERHEFSETKKLHESHGASHAAHGDEHAADAQGEKHEEKKADAHGAH